MHWWCTDTQSHASFDTTHQGSVHCDKVSTHGGHVNGASVSVTMANTAALLMFVQNIMHKKNEVCVRLII